ncbi:MAG TPA: molybdenum cofactor guanylyltransferase [Terriglobales bacterium]|nr:molybdenum cofactor guanylyltransferase [Terriglobales bacterium]
MPVGAITGFIIAGGKSSRMGTEKALLSIHGKTLIDIAIGQARSICEDILIAGPKETFSAYGRIVTDIYKDCGPLGGIHAALGRSETELNLMIAVDTPFLSKEFLVYLAAEARRTKTMVTLPRTVAGLQPLCAIYSLDFLPVAEKALQEKRLKLDALFHPATTHVVDLEHAEMKQRGFNAALFDNLNTREDYERVRREKKSRPANP